MKYSFTAVLTLILSFPVFSESYANNLQADLYPQQDIVSRYHNDWTQTHYRKRIQAFKQTPLKHGDIVFIGDSITEKGRDWANKLDIASVKNRGIAGDLTDGVLQRLNEVIYVKPKAVFILIGVNDLFNLHHKEAGGRFKYDKIVPSVRYVADNIVKISQLIQQQSQSTQVFVRTVLPTTRPYLKADIEALNQLIVQNRTKGNYKLIDLYQQFVDEKGEMQQALSVDGVHLSEAGYQTWVEFEKPIIERLSTSKK